MKGESRAEWQISNFHDAVDECGLRDIPWEGYKFTFDNGQAGSAKRQSMLDRAMCTGQWSDRFEQIWVGEEGCEEVVVRGLENGRGDLVSTLKVHARELQAWKKINIEKIKKLLEQKRRNLAHINKGGRTEADVKKRKKLVTEITALGRQDEQYWRQRSRALWLKDEDQNTNFFHTRAG
ncbi:uncharacterized protein LOC141651842 [Silene latifolia]|uniref:uncharacterized protein LOC141651842 n=1 Tax=Silene latifolia TaxID=37657 RepID=UPI003D77785A